ncbi:hypothetical protein QMK19_35325 [Streptomyces sp. H10-C2]|uniref:ParB family protein n=1 Tax=unclassified Streptomyces TaxID=2593676 RepID=UPI0024B8D5FC|nr:MULTISPECIES: hypothetical protein [unclassified Streptomyces]MDJ0345907.1 hypothetical protein [Streptomyces sp. PH10-H1]MDJ0374756.1 hypothetical protein [Streptomyces sp. H10-C2]
MTPTTSAPPAPAPTRKPSAAKSPGRRKPALALPLEPAEQEPVKSHSFSLPDSLMARLRAAVWHTQTKEDGYENASQLVREVLADEIERLEAKYNRGRPFPSVGRLRTGPSPEGAVRGAQIRAANRRAAKEAGGSSGDRT